MDEGAGVVTSRADVIADPRFREERERGARKRPLL
jgi:hypothetical protein